MHLARGDIEGNVRNGTIIGIIYIAHTYYTAVELDGRIFVAGGYGSGPDYPILTTFESFEPTLNQWVLREPMPSARG